MTDGGRMTDGVETRHTKRVILSLSKDGPVDP